MCCSIIIAGTVYFYVTKIQFHKILPANDVENTQNWGGTKAREGLADVLFIACGLLRAVAMLYKSEQVLPVADSHVSTEQSLFTCAVENGLRKLRHDRIKPDANSCCSVRC